MKRSSAVRKEAHKRASLALDMALRRTSDPRLVRKLARLLLHPARPYRP
jgi:hypothetical protein